MGSARVNGLLNGTQTFAAPAIVRRLDKTFSEDLTYEDRTRLRHIVRKCRPYLFARDDSDRHVDQVIDAIGPEVMRKLLFRALGADKVA